MFYRPVWFLALFLLCPVPTLQAQVQLVSLSGRDVSHLVADPNRPLVYALNRGAVGTNASLVALSATDGAILSELTLSPSPTDLDLSVAEDAIYVIHFGLDQIARINLATFVIEATQSFVPPGNWGGPADVWYDLKTGPAGTVYYIDGRWAPAVHAFNFTTGQESGTYDLDGSGVGDLAVSRDGNTLYVWAQYGWSAGSANSWVSRLGLSGNTFVRQQDSFTSGRRDPLDTPILLTASEDRVFNKQQCFASADLSQLLVSFSENLYEISLHGDLAVGTAHVFNAHTGAELYTLPFQTTVSAFSGDQKTLFLVNRATRELALVPVQLIADIPGPGLAPNPADGAVVGATLDRLSWSSLPAAIRYDVYLGTNASDVLTASPASPQHFTSTAATQVMLGESLTPRVRYFWRVDVVTVTSTNRSAVWSFDVFPATVVPSALRFGAIATFTPAPVSLAVQAPDGLAWTATETSPWFDAAPAAGSGSSTLTLTFATATLAPGSYTNSLTLTSEGASLVVPVIADIVPLDITRMVADYSRPYIYAFQAPPAGQSQASLLFINTDTEQVERVVPIGSNPTDMTVHYGEGRLYIADWGHTPTYVVDLETQELAPPLQLGTDIYKINAGRPGRLYIEGMDQWVSASIISTLTGAVAGSLPWPVRQGDGEVSPDGNTYYHCDDNISNAHIHKYDISTDAPVETAAGLEHPYGSRNLILSGDGSRLFWRGYVYDADLNELGFLGEEIHAVTLRGELAFGAGEVFNTANGAAIFSLPFETTIQAVAGKQDKVFLFNSSTHSLAVIPMNQIASVPGPGLVPAPADGAVVSLPQSQLSWSSSPLALRYVVYFGLTREAVATATPTSPEWLGESSTTSFNLAAELEPGREYFWRVDQVGFSGSRTGVVWQFRTASVIVVPQRVTARGVAGLPVMPATLTLSSPSGGPAWAISEDIPWLTPSTSSGTTPAEVELGFNTSGLAPGTYTGRVEIVSAGVRLPIEVSLELIRLALTRMLADRVRPYVYGLHRGSGTFEDAFLIVLNTASDQVERVIPIGSNPTDFSVHYPEERLYVSNWQRPSTRVIDLGTFTELPSLALGTDVYVLNAGRQGRLYIEGMDQWVSANIISTVTGAVASSLPWPVRQGDGEVSPDGNTYYHCDDNISNAHIHKYDISTDAPVETAAGLEHPFGSRNLVLSADGSRLFWRGFVYDADLQELGGLGDEIYACTADGAFAFSSTRVYDTATRALNFVLPFETTVMAVAGSAGKLYAFRPDTGAITNLPLAVIINRPPSAPNKVVTTPEDVPASIQLAAVDPEGDPLTYRVVIPPTRGSLTGTAPDLVYAPQANFAGSDSFSYVALDAYRTSVVAQVTINVTQVNDPPTANPQNLNVPPGGSREILLSGTDPEHSSLVFQVTELPAHGTLTGVPPMVLYTPQAAFVGMDSFSFRAHDGVLESAPATVTLEVTPPICVPPITGLLAWWRAEGDVIDAVGGFDGTAAPGLTYASGKVGQAFACGGTSAVVEVSATPRLQVAGLTNGWSLDAWIAPEAGTNRQVLLAWANPGSAAWLELALVPAGTDGASFWLEGMLRGSGGIEASVTSTTPLAASRFQHVALTFEPSTRNALLFRNGVVIGQAALLVSVPPAASGDLFLGGLPGPTPVHPFHGLLDEVALHDRPLAAAEIAALAGADSAGRCVRPLAPSIVAQPSSARVAVGGTASFLVEASGTGPLSFQWFHGSELLVDARGRWLTLTNVTFDQAGSYSVVVSNAISSVASVPAILEISLLTNGGFETGNFSAWTVQDVAQPLRALSVRTGGLNAGFGFFLIQPSEGRYCALHGWDGSVPGVIRLTQEVAVPTGGAALSFDYRAAWNLRDYGVATYPRVFRVAIEPAGGGAALASYSVLAAQPATVSLNTGLRTGLIDLAAFAGRSVRLAFEWTVPESNTGPALFELDDVALTAGAAAPPWLSGADLTRTQVGSVQLEFSAAAGRTYTVHGSGDLRTWTSLGLAVELTGGRFQFIDASAASVPQRFYRVSSP